MYRKMLVLCLAVVLLITGCTKISDNLDQVVDAVFENGTVAVNTVSTGYELYIPASVKQEKDNQYNQKFKIKDNYVYLYVDTISYFYKNALNYKPSDSYNYYYRELKNGNRVGYIGVNKVEENLYFSEIVFNYSKIEFYSNGKDLPMTLANALIIQKSIKYNDNLISIQLNDSVGDGREVKYQFDKPKDAESTFSQSLQEYVPQEDVEVVLPDDD